MNFPSLHFTGEVGHMSKSCPAVLGTQDELLIFDGCIGINYLSR